jgi:hypothetical protein
MTLYEFKIKRIMEKLELLFRGRFRKPTEIDFLNPY